MDTIFQSFKSIPLIKKNLTEEEHDWIVEELKAHQSWESLYRYYQKLKKQKDNMVENLKKYPKDYNALMLMTIHKSKGLAFDNVIIIGCYDGGIPYYQAVPIDRVNRKVTHEKAEPATTLEEERRLMYVAVTRARKNLYVTVPETISQKPCPRSPFLKELRLPVKKM